MILFATKIRYSLAMIALILFLIFILSVLGVGVLAGLSDWRGMTIPNLYSALIAGAFIPAYGLMWVMGKDDIFMSLLSHISALILVLAVSAALFFFRVMGAADSKLASAYALWLGVGATPMFLFVMSIVGAVLGAVALYIGRKKPFKDAPEESWIGQLQAGKNKVPYGIAIVCGAAYGFFHAGYLDLEHLASVFHLS